MRKDLTGAELIFCERKRQIEKEGWSAKHDDQHRVGQLAMAAFCYMRPELRADDPPPQNWPWDPEWWKPSDDQVRNLTKAGALLAAEIDRVRRLETRGQS